MCVGGGGVKGGGDLHVFLFSFWCRIPMTAHSINSSGACRGHPGRGRSRIKRRFKDAQWGCIRVSHSRPLQMMAPASIAWL